MHYFVRRALSALCFEQTDKTCILGHFSRRFFDGGEI